MKIITDISIIIPFMTVISIFMISLMILWVRHARLHLKYKIFKRPGVMCETLFKQSVDEQVNKLVSLRLSKAVHDLRSSVATLNIVAGGLSQMPDEIRDLIQAAVADIIKIANNLAIK